MSMICYRNKNFTDATEIVIAQANEIISDYQAQGYDLTLRQLYYQFVSRDLIPNTMQSYKRLGSIINDARLAGLISWTSIEDRTRNLAGNTHWDSPAEIVESAVSGYQIDKWADQEYRVEVWIEKEALSSVFARICEELDVDYFCCRGYVSQSEMWSAGQRLINYSNDGQVPIILHFGDHDPSGVDMSRDIHDRITMFAEHANVYDMELHRIALNMDQVRKYNPPPNPAKLTDSRCRGYIKEYGSSSWELDALEPSVLSSLVRDNVNKYINLVGWDDAVRRETKEKASLRSAANKLRINL